MIRKGIAVAVMAAVLAGVLAVAATASRAPKHGSRASHVAARTQADAVKVNLRALDRSATADDTLVASAAAVIERFGLVIDDTRRLGDAAGSTVFVSRVHNRGFDLCIAVIGADEVGTETCNSADGLAKGWLRVGDGHDVFGVVDDTVTRVDVVSDGGETIRSIVPVNNTYSFPQPSKSVEVSLRRAGGSEVARVPVVAFSGQTR